MIKLQDESRRHIIGLSAIALIIGGLGFAAASRDSGNVETLSSSGAQLAQQNPNEGFETRFLSMLRRAPVNAYGSAAPLAPEQDSATGVSGAAGARKTISAASDSNFWSEQDWQVARQAVAEHHAGRKPQDIGQLTWQPPEEIAQHKN